MIDLTLPATCGHLVKTVTASVQKVEPAPGVQIDLPTHQVVRIESARPAQEFKSALTEEGYAPA